MKREGYYGLLLALIAIAVIYYLNKAGLLHNSQYSMTDDAATLKEWAGTSTATVSVKVGGIPVGSETTVYPKSTLVIGGEFSDTAPVSQALRWGSNLF